MSDETIPENVLRMSDDAADYTDGLLMMLGQADQDHLMVAVNRPHRAGETVEAMRVERATIEGHFRNAIESVRLMTRRQVEAELSQSPATETGDTK